MFTSKLLTDKAIVRAQMGSSLTGIEIFYKVGILVLVGLSNLVVRHEKDVVLKKWLR